MPRPGQNFGKKPPSLLAPGYAEGAPPQACTAPALRVLPSAQVVELNLLFK